jgi:glycerol kinase
MPCILALDQSTSATKALLFDTAGHCLDRESREHRQYYPQPGWVEHDAGEIWQNTLAVLRTLVARHCACSGGPCPPSGTQGVPLPVGTADATEIAGLSLTNQRETIVVFDRATGRPLYPAIVWQDRRGNPLCAAQAAAGREPAIHARTGLKLDAYFSGSKLQWLVGYHPELRRQLAAGEALIGTIDAYLIYRLTGGAVFATDTTNASRTLLYDIGRLRWDEELCRWWDVPPAALPEVRESSARFGETTLDGALPRPLPICGVMGDSQASLFAQRCFQPGSAKVTFGTGSSVLLNIGSKLRLSERGVVTALAWVHRGVPTYAFEGIIISSAATLSWLRDQLGLVADLRELDRLALEISDNDGVYLVPAFSGLGLPHWQPAARAAIVGLSAHSDRRQVARAGLESIAYQVREALDAMRAEAGVPLRGLHGDGGTTINRFLMQFTADLTGVELRIATMADCSALGAALAGMLGLGVYRSLEEIAALPADATIFRPTMPPDRAQFLYAGWQRAVRQVLSAAA